MCFWILLFCFFYLLRLLCHVCVSGFCFFFYVIFAYIFCPRPAPPPNLHVKRGYMQIVCSDISSHLRSLGGKYSQRQSGQPFKSSLAFWYRKYADIVWPYYQMLVLFDTEFKAPPWPHDCNISATSLCGGHIGENKIMTVKIIFTKMPTTSIKMLSKQSNIQRGHLCSVFFDFCICLLMHVYVYVYEKPFTHSCVKFVCVQGFFLFDVCV